ncbi:MAG: NAD(P)H-binding protein [Candidatus Zixiibacteriota bacterium]|nr:MAG: NAD(P)H-binding protein [candidate division Zixibacteria bacterium]
MSIKILVVGGTGMLGKPVADRMANDGYKVRVMTHSPEKAKIMFGSEIELAAGDVTKPGGLIEAVRGCDGVYISLSAKMNPDNYELIERRGTADVARAAAEEGIKHIAMISGLNVGTADPNIPMYRAKIGAEKALIDSGIPYTIFRCSWFFESLPLFVVGKRAMVFGRQRHTQSWLAASDYAAMVSKAFSINGARNKIFHIRGIEKFSIPEALKKFCQIVFPKVKIRHVPIWMLSTIGSVTRNKNMKGLAQFLRFFEKNPESDVNGEAERILGPALTTLRDWAEEYKKRVSGESRTESD